MASTNSKPLPAFLRLQLEDDVSILALTAGLAHELALGVLDRLADRLAVGDLGFADIRLDTEFAFHAIDDDFEVKLAHARNDGLAGFLRRF